jgi:sugar phosphate isomerase/epimerase
MRVACRVAAAVLGGLAVAAAGRPTSLAVPIGYCATLKELEATKAAGFDYAELRVSEVAALPDADFEALVERVRRLGLPTPVANYFIPGSIKVTGPTADPAVEMAYVGGAFKRMARLGAGIVVFGSSSSRNVPPGFARDVAMGQLVAFCRRIGPVARANGITVAIEPLRRQESNIINTAAEGLDLVSAVSDPNFELMVDFYHLAIEKEDPAILIKARDHIRHLHMANPVGRVFPLKWEEYDYVKFFETLRATGYQGRISIEANATDFAVEAPQSIALLRRAFTSPPAPFRAARQAPAASPIHHEGDH